MFRIDFEFDTLERPIHEFELGHILIEFGGDTISSRNKSPNKSMMVLISAADLIAGLISIFDQKFSNFRFVGTDSSFSLMFQINSQNKIDIIYENNRIYETEILELVKQSCDSAKRIFKKYGTQFDGSGAAMDDLKRAISRAESLSGDS